MEAICAGLCDLVRSRWVSRKAEIACGTQLTHVLGLLALLLWRCNDDLWTATRRLIEHHGYDRPAWGVLICFATVIATAIYFEWARRAFRETRIEAEWRTTTIQLR